MRDHEKYLRRLAHVPENQTPNRSSAIERAIIILNESGVVDIPKTGSSREDTFGQFLKRSRKSVRPSLTQEQLADQSGVGIDWLRKGEQDRATFSIDAMCRIAVVLNLDDQAIRQMITSYTPDDKDVALMSAQFRIGVLRGEYSQNNRLAPIRSKKTTP